MKALAVGAWILGPGASALWGQSAGPTPHDSAHAVASARQAALDFFHNGAIGQARDKPSRPPALSCAVAADGKVVWAEAYGFADLEQRVPATTETGFRIGSVSKTLTAAAVVLLHQRGQLDIDVPIQQYVPTFPDKGYPITIRELAGHLGGIRHYRDADFPGRSDNVRHYDSLAQALAIFANDSLVAPPGTTWAYSSYGFNLIGIALEHATGKPFLDLMRDEVFVAGRGHALDSDRPRDVRLRVVAPGLSVEWQPRAVVHIAAYVGRRRDRVRHGMAAQTADPNAIILASRRGDWRPRESGDLPRQKRRGGVR
jgi:serine beta-lactamase-like protein LACTB